MIWPNEKRINVIPITPPPLDLNKSVPLKKVIVEIPLYQHNSGSSVNSKMVSSQSSSTHGASISKARLDGIGNVVAYP